MQAVFKRAVRLAAKLVFDPPDHEVDDAFMVAVGVEIPLPVVHTHSFEPEALHDRKDRGVIGIALPGSAEHAVDPGALPGIAMKLDDQFEDSACIGSPVWDGALRGVGHRGGVRGSGLRHFSPNGRFARIP